MYVHGLLDAKEYVSTFQSSYGNLISPIFPSIFVVSLSFAPKVSTASGSYGIKQFPVVIFDKHPREEAFFEQVISS